MFVKFYEIGKPVCGHLLAHGLFVAYQDFFNNPLKIQINRTTFYNLTTVIKSYDPSSAILHIFINCNIFCIYFKNIYYLTVNVG